MPKCAILMVFDVLHNIQLVTAILMQINLQHFNSKSSATQLHSHIVRAIFFTHTAIAYGSAAIELTIRHIETVF